MGGFATATIPTPPRRKGIGGVSIIYARHAHKALRRHGSPFHGRSSASHDFEVPC